MEIGKTKIIKALLLALSAFSVGWGQGNNSVWSAPAWVTRSLETSFSVRRAQLSVEDAEVLRRRARADRGPDLSASLSHSVGQQPWADVAAARSQSSVSLRSSWVLWDGGRLREALSLRQSEYGAAQQDAEQVRQTVVVEALQGWVALVQAQWEIEMRSALLEGTRERAERVSQRAQVGSATTADLAASEAELAREEYLYSEAERQLRLLRAQWRRQLELPETDSVRVESPDLEKNTLALGMFLGWEQVQQRVLSNSPRRRRDSLAVVIAHTQEKRAAAGYSPSLSLSGALSTGRSYQNWTPTENTWVENYEHRASLALSIPLWDKRATQSEVLRARLGRERAALDLRETERDLASQAEARWLSLRDAEKRWQAAKRQWEAAQLSYQLAGARWEQGMLTPAEWTTQRGQWEQAMVDRGNALLAMQMERWVLDVTMGEWKW